MQKIIRFIVNYLNRFLPHQEVVQPREKEYSKAKVHSILRRLERLQTDTKEKRITCSLKISTDPSVCIRPTCEFLSKSDFLNPKKNSNIFTEFYFANGINEPLLNFWVGTDRCVLESVRSISREERVLFKKALPFSFIDKDPDRAFLLFSNKINFLIDLKEKTDRSQEISLKEVERDSLHKKLRGEHTEYVLNELSKVNRSLVQMKKFFNERFGYKYSV